MTWWVSILSKSKFFSIRFKLTLESCFCCCNSGLKQIKCFLVFVYDILKLYDNGNVRLETSVYKQLPELLIRMAISVSFGQKLRSISTIRINSTTRYWFGYSDLRLLYKFIPLETQTNLLTNTRICPI